MAGDPRHTLHTLPMLGDLDVCEPAIPSKSPLGQLGRYELLSLLAKGGMGEVFLARSRGIGGFDKLVVIKRNLPSMAIKRESLFAEARLVATLQHTNIVQVYDVDTDGPTVFIAMEFLHGQDLRNVLRRSWGDGGRLPLDQAIASAMSVCAGIHYAHDKRDTDGTPLEIVHRDVSPSNVFITYDGGVKLIDFGIAKSTTLPSETQLGTIKGKPGYMSPEQCRGEPLDRRSDLFCLGILLYEMTTGRRPFHADNEYLTYKLICEGEPNRPTTLDAAYPAALEAIVLRAIAKDRRDRHPTAHALQEELAGFASKHRLDVSQFALGRYMGSVFRDELDAWRDAERTGQSLVEHVIRSTTSSVQRVQQVEPIAAGPLADEHRSRSTRDVRSNEANAVGSPTFVTIPNVGRSRRWRLAALAVIVVAGAAIAVIASNNDPGDSPVGATRRTRSEVLVAPSAMADAGVANIGMDAAIDAPVDVRIVDPIVTPTNPPRPPRKSSRIKREPPKPKRPERGPDDLMD